MEWNDAEVQAAASRLTLLADPRRRREGAGALMGKGPGSSLEFHDHRDYQPGDDLRHLDWSAYARTGSLIIRRHRQEVHPRLEVLLDTSASMAATPAKAGLAAALASLLMQLGEAGGGRPRLWLLGPQARTAPQWSALLSACTCAGSVAPQAAIRLMGGGERVLISDGLWPGGGAAALPRLIGNAGRFCLVQILTADEVAPQPSGPSRLRDCEMHHGDHSADQVIDAAACAAYRVRLARHNAGWQQVLHGRGAGVITCMAEAGLSPAVRALIAARVLCPRAG